MLITKVPFDKSAIERNMHMNWVSVYPFAVPVFDLKCRDIVVLSKNSEQFVVTN